MRGLKKDLILIVTLTSFILIAGLFFNFLQSEDAKPKAFVQGQGATLVLASTTGNTQVFNNTFDVRIKLQNPAARKISGIDIYHLNYPTQYLDVIDTDTVKAGTQIDTSGSIFGTGIIYNSVDTTNGWIDFTGGFSPSQLYTGTTGLVATVRFKTKTNSGQAPLTLSFTQGANNDCNVAAIEPAEDILESTPTLNINIVSPSINIKSKGLLEGRTADYSATGAIIKIYPANTTDYSDTNVLYTSPAFGTDNTGSGTVNNVTWTGFNATQAYDIRFKAPWYLSRTIKNKILDGSTLDFGTCKAGDANNDNIINGNDITPYANTIWLKTGYPQYDFDKNNLINSLDRNYVINNYYKEGE